MKIKTKLSDYKVAPLEFDANGESITLNIRSMACREFKEAQSEYLALINHAKKNDIPLVEKFTIKAADIEIEEEKRSDFAAKAMAKLHASLVVDWPFDEDLVQAIVDNPDFGEAIDRIGGNLAKEFADVKKT